MGAKLAQKILSTDPSHDIDIVMPIPETSRTSALRCAAVLKRPYREGFVKNRYIARTFIMPGQEMRRKTVRLKLNAIKSEFKDKVVLLIDDSIVRGTTSMELVQLAREAGAKKVYFASAAPPVRFSNVYGIDIPTRRELIAYNRTNEDIAAVLGADKVVYNDLEDVEEAVRSINPSGLQKFDSSCFNGVYVTEEVTSSYLLQVEASKDRSASGRGTPVVAVSTPSESGALGFGGSVSGVASSGGTTDGEGQCFELIESSMETGSPSAQVDVGEKTLQRLGSEATLQSQGSCESLHNGDTGTAKRARL